MYVFPRPCVLVPALAAALALAPAAQATEIGSVSAANHRIDGVPPNQSPRVLELGNRIFADELITSSDIGSGQFVFLDQTTLTVSPGSEILLDRYIFDPDTGSGEIALTLTKGVLRFIGGKVTKTGEATVKTPHATIGIRGGIAAITVGQAGTNAVFLAGKNMCVAGKSKPLCVTRPGGMVTVKASEGQGGSEGTRAAGAGEGTSSDDGTGDGSGGTPGSNTPSIPAGSDLGEPEYVGVASPEDIGLIFEASDTGGDGGTTQPMEPQVVASTSTQAGMTQVGAESPGAPTEPPVSTEGDEAQPGAEEGAPPGESTTEARSEPETTATSGPPEEISDGGMGGFMDDMKTDISTLPTIGVAAFSGIASADIIQSGQEGSFQFSQDGTFVMSYDFEDRTGGATISGIGNSIFVSTISEGGAAAGEHFGGALIDSSNFSNVGSIDGSFFTSQGDATGAANGSFDFNRTLDNGDIQSGVGDFQSDKLN